MQNFMIPHYILQTFCIQQNVPPPAVYGLENGKITKETSNITQKHSATTVVVHKSYKFKLCLSILQFLLLRLGVKDVVWISKMYPGIEGRE